jgi:hypothetical protein
MAMERKQLIALCVIVIVIGVAGVGFVLLSTPTHYEREYPAESSKYVRLGISVEDCNLSISFRNDSTLMYSIDVEVYSDSDFKVNYREGVEYHSIQIGVFSGQMPTGPARLKSLDIILGTAATYQIVAGGNNLDTSIVYGNGAKLGQFGNGVDYSDDDVIYKATGSVQFTFEDDVDFSGGGLDVMLTGMGGIVNYLDSAILDIDLPEGMDGRVCFFDSVMSVDNNGWIPYPNKYQTGTDQPLLDVHVTATIGSMNLNIS